MIVVGVAMRPWTLLALAAVPMSIQAIWPVFRGATGRGLIPALERTGKAQLVYGVLLAAGLWFI